MEHVYDFKPTYKKGKIGRDKIVKAMKDYPNACERCGGSINKGELYLNASEYALLGNSFYAQRYSTHRLCESCLEVLQEVPYNEAQAEWVKKNKLRNGDRVRIMRKAESFENGWPVRWYQEMDGFVGHSGVVMDTCDGEGIVVDFGSMFNKLTFPYFVLRIVRKIVRPYKDNELNDLVGKTVVHKYTGNAMMILKVVDCKEGKSLVLHGKTIDSKELCKLYTFKNKEVCGVEEVK